MKTIQVGELKAEIDLGYMVPSANEQLLGISQRYTYAQQSLNAVIDLLATYTRTHKQLKARLWAQYQGDSTITKKSKSDFDTWITRNEEYQRDLETHVWLESAYETISRTHIPRLKHLESLALRGEAHS